MPAAFCIHHLQRSTLAMLLLGSLRLGLPLVAIARKPIEADCLNFPWPE
jgi:hypothetical protein